ncbi:radical SAM family heme chaperone HemW [Psychroserpens damuponensis]|uniref:radical SAM family heme chaperone HemW n=1 Tax=Psychroserpens damuponensis TaxID=943936 RepID=UPI00058FDB1A|nr:radical SAM family heme chaperone HemW [Psychroserpens damuponensis]
MSGIYIHIPFCKQACHYCDFHFSTSLKKRDELVNALAKELSLRKFEFKTTIVETIYFGGGTPSLLTIKELDFLIQQVYANYNVSEAPEITLEANPDDLIKAEQSVKIDSGSIFEAYKNIGINRLSIGIQSFFEDDLKLMNRAHNAKEAKACLDEATQYFDNISIDLIYGIPGLSNQQWQQNIDLALSFGIPHISSYALTVEPKTALESFIKKGIIANVDDDLAHEQFHILVDALEAHDFVHYELSNFGKHEFFSKNNSAYWQGKPYLGIGPSAHSFVRNERSWNVRNNSKYITAIEAGTCPKETEILSVTDSYNEYIMTGLRTVWGVSLVKVETQYGLEYKKYLLKQSQTFINQQLLYIEDEKLLVTKKGKFLCDGIASQLFKINEH